MLFGAGMATLAFGVAIFGGLPARWAYACHEARLGKSLWQFFVLGVAVDGYSNGTVVGVGALVLLVSCGRAPFRASSSGPIPRSVRIICAAWVALLWIGLWLGGIAATEFRLQRGLYPTWADLRGTSHGSYWLAALGTLWLDRYLQPGMVAVPAAIACLVLSARRWHDELWRRWTTVVGYASCCAVLFVTGWAFWFFSSGFLSDVVDRREVTSTFGSLVPFGATRNVSWGLRAAIEAIHHDAETVAVGATMIGLPPGSATSIAGGPVSSCEPHPFRRPFPDEELDALRQSGRADAGEAFEPRLVGSLVELSRALFSEGAPAPVHVWQLLLEGVRADDIHALNPGAPRDLAPFINALYEGNVAGYQAIGARHMHQAGVRTSQGLAASVCGLGSMPYDVSFARDLGVPPTRCLTDVLVDAKFDTSFVYGEGPSFDNMLDFLQAHRVRHFLVEKRFPPSPASGGWGLGDLALVRGLFPIRASDQGDPSASAAYTLVLTLSNHHPFRRPPDTPAVVDDRVSHAWLSAQRAGTEDRDRLLTYAYTDEAVRELFDTLATSPWGNRSLVVVSADHSTNDPFIWGDARPIDGTAHAAALSRIPFAVVVPDAWIQSLRDGAAARAALAAVRAVLPDLVLSQNDVPTMILALLSHAPQLATLAPDKRWHTLGGQRTSPYFRSDSLGNVPVWGIDSTRAVFVVHPNGTTSQNGQYSLPVIGDPTQAAASIEPIAGLLGAFLRNYDGVCQGAQRAAPSASAP